ncbi:cytochrome P450 2C25 [Caerostris extrusa]|uniref:Cytochrome P450 2C25 n=1 Tax=Caerostris extrusa TaxID=172846 RepID=A0AAV4XLN6_CAEEX|nr:cytochrome P450 2C25 [Caerostris extrusa]
MQNTVILHGPEVIKEAMNKTRTVVKTSNQFIGINKLSKFSKRINFFSKNLNEENRFEIRVPFGGDFHAWKEQRKFVVHSMKDLGLGKTKIEDDVMDEINHFIEVLRLKNGEPMDVKGPLSPSMSNNICALVFGKRYKYDDKDRQFLDSNLEEVNESITQTSSDTLFPFLRYIPFYLKFLKVERSLIAFNNLKSFMRKELDKHLKTLDPGHIRDFIDSYFLEMDSQKAKNPNTTFSYEMLVSSVTDVFGAGSETVRTSILWFIYIMAAYPEVQKKVQQEILEVIGTERRPEYLNMKCMPYTHAIIMEIMRWKTIVPLNLAHYAMADTKVGGYDIPKGTTVIANLWNAHHDPRYWNEPHKFKPERFLSEDGKSVVKSSNFMPFSLGRRVCPGESMAYMEIFLYFTSILQKFDIKLPEGMKPTFEAKLTITYRLEPFKVRFLLKQ